MWILNILGAVIACGCIFLGTCGFGDAIKSRNINEFGYSIGAILVGACIICMVIV